ncbi:MAG: SH3 domain-containing protein [Intestinibacter sp.]|uniref:C40 family peptidase n=1 Tax=Intestinibacter sp. TaxID=1965304 RepID=UPI0025BBA81D|nr:C40 family peptidase [Intestinibacter sp.]MCI6738418.1 SH3 domain-containing protein [Intestinibacter sp.]
MNFDLKKALIGTAIVLPVMGLSISNADSIESLIINGSVNFRVAPSKDSTKIDKLQKGEKVEYLGESGNWYKVKYNGQTGYIYKTYASVSSTAEETNNLVKIVNCSSLNLRSGAGTNYSIIKTLSKGTQVTVLSTSGNWSKVSVNSTTGYVYSSYLSSVSSTADDQVENNTTNEDTNVKYYRYTSTTLNFRQNASTSSSVICKLPKNTKVGVVSVSSTGWAKVKYNGSFGYVSNSYLSETQVGLTAEKDSNYDSSTTKSQKIDKIISIAKSKLGCTYVRGSEGPNTFDCTGLTYYLYKQVGITIPRGTADQKNVGSYVSKSDLQPGDLVFLDTKGNDGIIDHASIYIGNNTIIHANSVAGKVCTSDLTTNYYKNAYVSARRVLD